MRLALVAAISFFALLVAAPAWAASGLVAAYAFDEGSGSVAVDASGNGHSGVIAGAGWVPGRYGSALSFDGSTASVDLGGLGTFYQQGFTLEAWVQKQSATRNDVAVVGSWDSGGPMIWVDHIVTRYHLTLGNDLSNYLDSGRNPIAGQWQFLAATFDGTTARVYIDGVETASKTFTGSVGGSNSWRIGAYGASPRGFFDGLIDNVRIYNRGLSASEVQADMDQPVAIANAGAPTAPGSLTVTSRTQTSLAVQWDASTDDVGVTGYNVYRDGTLVGTTAGTSFAFADLSCSTSYQIAVEAFDGSGNTSQRAQQGASTGYCNGPPAGLVAAYSFDEGAGGVAVDESGNGHGGTIFGATWGSGRYGSGLAFNGSSAFVDLGSLGTFYKTGFTLEAWVQKQSSRADAGLVGTWDGGGPMLWVDHLAGHYRVTMGGSLSDYLDSGISPVPGQWQHVAETYDGTTVRIYIDGVQAATETFTGNAGDSNTWKIGAYGSSARGFLDGSVDDVRIYNHALTANEVLVDMGQPVTADSTPPSAPGTLTATGSLGRATLSWGAATDDVAVTRYDVYRSTSAGFTPSSANQIAQPTGTTYTDNGLAGGTYYYRVTAEDQVGHVGAPSNEASATVTVDGAPTVAITAPSPGTVSGMVTITANAVDDIGVAGVQFRLDGQNLGAEVTTSPYTLAWDTRGELNDSHTLTAVARDTAGHTTTSAVVAVVVSNAGVSSTGLRIAYGFDEGAGALAHDSSGNNRSASLSGTAWSTVGRYGGSLSFNGTSAEADPPNLGTFYKTGFTYEAWVRKQSTRGDAAILGSWTSGGGGGPMLWVDHIASHYRLTLGNNLSNYLDSGRVPIPGQWQHIAATYDGTTARIYIDGVQTASSVFTGNVGNANNWRIGAYGATPAGFFDGLIDNVRVYDRALSAAEIQTDMVSRIRLPDTTPPTAPTNLIASGGAGRATLGWGAASDNVGVTRYDVYRSTSAGFTPSSSNRIAQPTGTSYIDSGLAAGTYYYRVTAEDQALNESTPSNQASAAVTADTTPPTVSIKSPAAGTVTGVVTVKVSTNDNVGVAGVQYRLDGQNLGAEVTSAPYSFSWDTRGEVNGPHTLTAVARDAAGNTATSSVAVTVTNTGVSTTGLRVAYGLDDGSGSIAVDSSGNNRTGTLNAGSWTTAGHFGGAVSLNGSSSEVDPPALGTFYRTGFTLEAWIKKQSSKVDVAVLGTWVGTSGGGPMIWIDSQVGHYDLTLGNSSSTYLDSGRSPSVGQWQHVAATYDGSTARIYVDGVQTASSTFTGSVGNSDNWRIGAYGATSTGFFDGLIDNVRIYDRALSAAEIQTDMVNRIQPDRTAPQVVSSTPANGAVDTSAGTAPTARFNEPMQAATINGSTFELRDGANALVPATVTYDAAAKVATLTPQAALQFGTTYRATLKAGGARDLAGNALSADVSWSFTTQASPPPVLVFTSSSNPFTSYVMEILRNEGMDTFTSIDIGFASPSLLSRFDVVVLGDVALTSSQVSMLTSWVNGGGNLVAMRPDKQLAGLLGLTDAGTTRANAYLKVDTTSAPGAGIVGSTIQYHGTADNYTLNGASAVATLYSSATAATTNPAVTLRSVGSSGGQAAAFTYDLARSVVYTRQGNPAWAGQERDGALGVRSDDLFFGAKSGDVQPDWVDTSKIAIPQADEQQRLLVNLITEMERDKMPLPHFWYLPRGSKAVVAMSGDDHAQGGTASHFDRFSQLSPPGCVVANWECVRSTSFIYPDSPLTNAQAAGYVANGFEVAVHPSFGGCNSTPSTPTQLANIFDTQLAQFRAKYTSVPAQVSSRTHCVEWPDWATEAKVELARGIRIDGNYYHFPDTWIGNKPGFLTGGGFPMRFADSDGSLIDVYQQNTNMNDEAGQAYPATVNTLLDNAVGPLGYYGAFGVNIHTDSLAPNPNADAIVNSALAHGVPVVSYKQLLTWVDGRNSSTIQGLGWSGSTLTFATTVGAGANGLQTMLPAQGPTGTLSSLTCGGLPKTYTLQTIKGIQYAMFGAITGTCQATY